MRISIYRCLDKFQLTMSNKNLSWTDSIIRNVILAILSTVCFKRA